MARCLALALLYAALTLNQGCESATTQLETKQGASESDQVATDDGVSQTNDASVETGPTGLTEFSWREDEQELTAESLFEENVNAVWGLEGGRVLVHSGDQIILFDNGEWRAPLSTSVQISNIVRAANDTLLHTNEGLLVLRDGQLNPSPLDQMYPELRALVGVDRNQFWLVEENRLTLWQNDASFSVEYAAPNADVHWQGGVWAGRPTLMLWLDARVSLLEFRDGDIIETTIEFTNSPNSVAMNATGMWLITEAGLLHRAPDGEWTVNPEVDSTSRLFATFHQSFLYLVDEETVRRVDLVTETLVELPEAWSDATLSSNGDFLLYGESGLHRVRAARSLEISGTYDGPLLEDRMLSASVDPPEEFQSPRWTNELGEVIAEGWTLALSAASLRPGRFSIRFSAVDSNGEMISRDIELEGPPSWETHVAPLSDRWCQNCHGADSSFPLATSAEWVAHFDLILYDLETGRMPLTPDKPTEADTALIRGWGHGGFQFLGENE